jgi:hypothetical protein
MAAAMLYRIYIYLIPVLWIRIRLPIGSGFNGVPGSVSGFAIRIRIQEGKNGPEKKIGVNVLF